MTGIAISYLSSAHVVVSLGDIPTMMMDRSRNRLDTVCDDFFHLIGSLALHECFSAESVSSVVVEPAVLITHVPQQE
jgi:hypothetical protein